jgi:hypothetical protein
MYEGMGPNEGTRQEEAIEDEGAENQESGIKNIGQENTGEKGGGGNEDGDVDALRKGNEVGRWQTKDEGTECGDGRRRGT